MIQVLRHKEWSDITAFGRTLVAIYAGVGNTAELVWEKVRCCFSKGYWLNDLPWLDGEPWLNEP